MIKFLVSFLFIILCYTSQGQDEYFQPGPHAKLKNIKNVKIAQWKKPYFDYKLKRNLNTFCRNTELTLYEFEFNNQNQLIRTEEKFDFMRERGLRTDLYEYKNEKLVSHKVQSSGSRKKILYDFEFNYLDDGTQIRYDLLKDREMVEYYNDIGQPLKSIYIDSEDTIIGTIYYYNDENLLSRKERFVKGELYDTHFYRYSDNNKPIERRRKVSSHTDYESIEVLFQKKNGKIILVEINMISDEVTNKSKDQYYLVKDEYGNLLKIIVDRGIFRFVRRWAITEVVYEYFD